MTKDGKVKILVLGPVSTGKTSICNYLGDTAEIVSGGDRPTKGVRIVEFMVDGVAGKSKGTQKTEVELWDCSGDPAYEQGWPALRHNADAIVFVYTSNTGQQRQVLAKMHAYFVESCGFPEKSCIVFRNVFEEDRITGNDADNEVVLGGINHAVVDLGKRDQELRKTFNSFLRNVLK